MKDKEIQGIQIRICNACKQHKKCDKELCTMSELVAKELSRFYQPKLPKDSVVLSKGAYESLSSKAKANVVNAIEIRNETAEKILKAFEYCNDTTFYAKWLELCKQFAVKIKE